MVKHQLAQQELESNAALSYEDYLQRLTQAVDTEVRCRWLGFGLKSFPLFIALVDGLKSIFAPVDSFVPSSLV